MAERYERNREDDEGRDRSGPFNRYSQINRGPFNRWTKTGPRYRRDFYDDRYDPYAAENRSYFDQEVQYESELDFEPFGGRGGGRRYGYEWEEPEGRYERNPSPPFWRTSEDFGQQPPRSREDEGEGFQRGYSRTYYNRGWDYHYNYPEEGERSGAPRRQRDYGYGYKGRQERLERGIPYEEIWDLPGPYTGKGPKGFQPTDKRIFEQVCERLTQHGNLDASEIEISVQDGVVTLSGTVTNLNERHMAADTAETVAGVAGIRNRLRVSE